MQYADFVTSVATLMAEQDPTNSDFLSIVPNMIDYAEKRCYRDLDMLGQRYTDNSGLTQVGIRTFTIPGAAEVLEGVNIINNFGIRSQVVPVSREFINFAYPNNIAAGIPLYFAMVDQSTIFLAPWPDGVYQVEVQGVRFPAPLGSVIAGNQITTTQLTVHAPDLFLAAAMIFASAYQKNFGAQSDDPQTAQSWEQQYQSLVQSAKIWEVRKKFYSEGWSSKGPNPIATPPRV